MIQRLVEENNPNLPGRSLKRRKLVIDAADHRLCMSQPTPFPCSLRTLIVQNLADIVLCDSLLPRRYHFQSPRPPTFRHLLPRSPNGNPPDGLSLLPHYHLQDHEAPFRTKALQQRLGDADSGQKRRRDRRNGSETQSGSSVVRLTSPIIQWSS